MILTRFSAKKYEKNANFLYIFLENCVIVYFMRVAEATNSNQKGQYYESGKGRQV